MAEFLTGLYAAFTLVAIAFFFRFWRESADKLFLKFAADLLLLAIERIVCVAIDIHNEATGSVYLLRLGAFGLIIWAMIEKNKRKQME